MKYEIPEKNFTNAHSRTHDSRKRTTPGPRFTQRRRWTTLPLMVRASSLPVAPTVVASRLRVDRARLRAADPREQLRTARFEAVRRLHESARAHIQIQSKASLPASASAAARADAAADGRRVRQRSAARQRSAQKGGAGRCVRQEDEFKKTRRRDDGRTGGRARASNRWWSTILTRRQPAALLAYRHQLDSRMRVSRPGHGTGREGGGSVNP